MGANEDPSGAAAEIVAYVDASLEPLIPRYMTRREDDAREIEAAVAAGDFEKVRILGHTMKGSGGGYGLEFITEVGERLENAGKDTDAAAALQGVAELRAYLSEVRIEYVDE